MFWRMLGRNLTVLKPVQLRHKTSNLRIVCRMVLLLLIGFVRCVVNLVEQPSSTLMMAFPYVRWLSKMTALFFPWLITRLLESQFYCQWSIVQVILSNRIMIDTGHEVLILKNMWSNCPDWVAWPSMGIEIWSQRWSSDVRIELRVVSGTT